MKTIFCFVLLTLSCSAQIDRKLDNRFDFNLLSLPIHYFPFYNGVQIIEVDYYEQSLEQGALYDALYPRGGSYFHDAMNFNRSNGYLIRSMKGEIVANYGVMNLQELKLSSPDSCEIITHQEYLNSIRNKGHYRFQQNMKDLNGYGYRISQIFVPQQRSEMPEMGVELFGILDTMGNIAIPMDHFSIDYANGEYLVTRNTQHYYPPSIPSEVKKGNAETVNFHLLPFAIYDSIFQLTLIGTNTPLQRIGKNCYADITTGCVNFMDRYGNSLHPNYYLDIQKTHYSDLLIYTERKNDTLFRGLLSRELIHVTPAIFTSVTPFEDGFMVRDHQDRNGYLNLFGKQVVPFELEAVSINIRKDNFIVFTRHVQVPNGKMLCSGLIDSSGRVILDPIYWQIDLFNNGIAMVKKDNKWGLINLSGEIICPNIYESMGSLHRNFIEVFDKGKRGLLERTGKVILEPNYKYVTWVDSLIHFGNDLNENFIFNFKTGETIKHEFGVLIPQNNGLSFYMKGNKYGLVSAQGKLLIPAQYDKVRAFRNNLAIVEINGKLGLINQYGKIVQAVKYSSYSYDDNGNYLLK